MLYKSYQQQQTSTYIYICSPLSIQAFCMLPNAEMPPLVTSPTNSRLASNLIPDLLWFNPTDSHACAGHRCPVCGTDLVIILQLLYLALVRTQLVHGQVHKLKQDVHHLKHRRHKSVCHAMLEVCKQHICLWKQKPEIAGQMHWCCVKLLACCTHQLRHHLGSLAVGCWEANDCLGLAFIERQCQRQGILVLASLHQHVNALKHTSQRSCNIWNSP